MTRRHRRSAILMSISAAALATNLSPLARADTTATWDGTTNNWSSAAHWSTNPNYPNNGTPAGTLYDVIVSAGTVTLNVNPTIQLMNMSGGTISGSDSLTILGVLTWSEGTLGAAAETADGGINFSGSGTTFLDTGTLTNPAGQSATIGATGNIYVEPGDGATFDNAGTLTATNGSIYSGGGATSTVNNSGTFTVNEASATFTIGGGLIFNNSGTVSVKAGELLLAASDNGSTTGTATVSSGATVAFTANYTFASSSTLTGAGAYYFSGGEQTINTANYNVTGTTYLTTGTLAFGVNENIQGPLVWSGGTMIPGANVTVTAKSGIDFHGSNYAFLDTGILTNPAGQSATIGATGNIYVEPGDGATFNNAGTLTATNGGIYSDGGATSTVNNSGTFTVNEASATFSIGSGLIFNNSGTLNVLAGDLLLAASDNGSTTGTVSVSSGASITFTANYTFSSSATLTGAGAYYFSGGEQTINTANYNVTGTTYLTSGTLAFGVNENIQGPLVWTYGTMTPAANVTVTAKSGIDFHGNQYAFLNTGILTNPAGQSATIGATGAIYVEPGDGATFNNAGTLTATNGDIYSDGGATSTLNNSGTMNVNEPSATFSIGSGLQFNNTGKLFIQGGTLAIASPYSGSPAGTVSVSSTGALTSSAKFTQPAGITNNGVLVFDATGDTSGAITGTGSVTISGGTFQFNTGSGASSLDQLTVSAGSLDITNNHIFINYGSGPDPISSIAALIASGYNGGAWNGGGIISSTAAVNASYGIGYADSADPGNPAGLSAGQIEIKYTLLGDANLDDKVNGSDFTLMAANFNDSVSNGWDKGDFNYDGKVNGSDFVLLADNFNDFASQSDVSAADLTALDDFAAANGISLTDVPEPTCGIMGMILVGGLLARRYRARGQCEASD